MYGGMQANQNCRIIEPLLTNCVGKLAHRFFLNLLNVPSEGTRELLVEIASHMNGEPCPIGGLSKTTERNQAPLAPYVIHYKTPLKGKEKQEGKQFFFSLMWKRWKDGVWGGRRAREQVCGNEPQKERQRSWVWIRVAWASRSAAGPSPHDPSVALPTLNQSVRGSWAHFFQAALCGMPFHKRNVGFVKCL